MKFAANLSWLFKEEACLLKRIDLAAKAGFTHVELAWPYDYSVSEFKRAVESSKVGDNVTASKRLSYFNFKIKVLNDKFWLAVFFNEQISRLMLS